MDSYMVEYVCFDCKNIFRVIGFLGFDDQCPNCKSPKICCGKNEVEEQKKINKSVRRIDGRIMTLKQIIQKYLEENNFAGLCSGECGCSKDDLFPCGEPKEDCQAALWMPCNDCNPDIDRSRPYCEDGDGCYYVPVKYGVEINENISSL